MCLPRFCRQSKIHIPSPVFLAGIDGNTVGPFPPGALHVPSHPITLHTLAAAALLTVAAAVPLHAANVLVVLR